MIRYAPKGSRLSVSLADARRIIAAGEVRAHELGQPMNIAVVDREGSLVSHVRMDGAWSGSVDVSITKAVTVRAGAEQGQVMAVAGGLPLLRDGDLVGGVGVSGGSDELDHEVALAAAAAL